MRTSLILFFSILTFSSVSADVCSECTWLNSRKSTFRTMVDGNIRRLSSLQIQRALLLIREPFTAEDIEAFRFHMQDIQLTRMVDHHMRIAYPAWGLDTTGIPTEDSKIHLTDKDLDNPLIARVFAIVGIPLTLADGNDIDELLKILNLIRGETCYDFVAMEKWHESRSEALTATRVDLQNLLPIDVTQTIGGFLRGDKDYLTAVSLSFN
jgi:hypothetical protein